MELRMELNTESAQRADDLIKRMLSALDEDDLTLITECKLSQVLMEINHDTTKM